MRDFVPHSIGDHFFEFRDAPSDALVRVLVNRDPVGERGTFRHAPVGQRAAFVEAEQTRARRFLLDNKQYVIQKLAKAPRSPPQSPSRDSVELFGWQHG
jgi:hypothetical protein